SGRLAGVPAGLALLAGGEEVLTLGVQRAMEARDEGNGLRREDAASGLGAGGGVDRDELGEGKGIEGHGVGGLCRLRTLQRTFANGPTYAGHVSTFHVPSLRANGSKRPAGIH